MSFSPERKNFSLERMDSGIMGLQPNFQNRKPDKIRLPRLVQNQSFQINHFLKRDRKANPKTSEKSQIKLTTKAEFRRIESLIHSKPEINILQRINNSYTKLSHKQKIRERLSFKRNRNLSFKYWDSLQKKSGNSKMVDVTLNTDDV